MINKITQELKTKGFNLEVVKEYNEKYVGLGAINDESNTIKR